jgi:muramoyltetrapeptide carboxypeptidase
MIQPAFLRKGDKISIVSPARSITFEEVHPSIRLFQGWGLEVMLGTHVFDTLNQFAGTDSGRRADLQQAMDDPSVRAIVCTRGGYGTVRLVDGLDFSAFAASPKWIAGYSDITVLHSHIHRNFGIQTLHATMPYNIKSGETRDESAESLRKTLFGEKISYQQPATFHDRAGLSEGILTGGNLSILYSLMGSASEPDTDGRILFLEDVDEYLYHVDRMMINLKRAGKLENLKGMIVGGLTGMKDNDVPFGKDAREIIADAVKEYAYPVCFDFPAGHAEKNLALYFGRMARLMVAEKVELSFP